MSRTLHALGWMLRACALICIAWTAGGVISGAITSVEAIASAAVFHGTCALTGVGLVGQARRMAATTAGLMASPKAA